MPTDCPEWLRGDANGRKSDISSEEEEEHRAAYIVEMLDLNVGVAPANIL